MAQPARTVRWRSATNRGINARAELQTRFNDMVYFLEEFLEDLSETTAKLDDAAVDLICLQKEYETMSMPESFCDSRTQEKIFNVTLLNFQGMRDAITKFEAALNHLKEFDPAENDSFLVLDEARISDLPKFYGRD